MSSFRDQLGEDWLRYQHHLDAASPSIITSQSTPQPQPLPNGLNATTTCPSTSPGPRPSSSPSQETPELLPPPLLLSEDMDEDPDTESTLQWPGHGSRPTESILQDSTVDGPLVDATGQSPGSHVSVGGESLHTKEEEEEEDLGGRDEKRKTILHDATFAHHISFFSPLVDLCHPLLVGVLSDREEDDSVSLREQWSSRRRREVFLRIKQGLVLEVDVQHGQERCRLELGSLVQVETMEAAWTREVRRWRQRAGCVCAKGRAVRA